ncbi:Os05g0479250 [Oryza sativa Japonica Group]|uniref:Os05g0479250 protein n=1 Tax=Oryza sativa subsp. japonica TaxID=39947 RepID=A0A0P0WNT1_ORYSJ|nr:Os05g0479250 [Oryza sativa Japonica Group]
MLVRRRICMRPSVPGVYAYELLLWARKELENLEVFTADDGGGGGGNTVHGDKAPVDGKGEAATLAKRADVSGGQECGVVRVEDVQRVETPAAEITNAMKDTKIVKNKDQERGGSEREEEETVAMAGTGSREEALLVLFDTTWQ